MNIRNTFLKSGVGILILLVVYFWPVAVVIYITVVACLIADEILGEDEVTIIFTVIVFFISLIWVHYFFDRVDGLWL